MMKKEFAERTGFNPSDKDYKKIEKAYYDYDGDKDDFCKAWLQNSGVQDLYNEKTKKLEEFITLYKGSQQEIKRLRLEIERLEKWEPSKSVGTRFSQTEYESLLRSCKNKAMTDEEAIDYIYEETGFDKSEIKLINTVNTYEVNCEHKIRRSGGYIRFPLYFASDWNYIRFDCRHNSWEIINGLVVPYNS